MAKELQTSDARIRTILGKLHANNLIVKPTKPTIRRGHHLSEEGIKFWEQCRQFLRIPAYPIHLGSLSVGNKDFAVCIEGSDINQLNTVVLRDEALVNGALGCTVFLQESSAKIYLLNAIYPPLPEKPLTEKSITRKISRITSETPWKKVIIIVGTADLIFRAKIGAIAASLPFLPDYIKNVIENIL